MVFESMKREDIYARVKGKKRFKSGWLATTQGSSQRSKLVKSCILEGIASLDPFNSSMDAR
jgi:hypothetical protein